MDDSRPSPIVEVTRLLVTLSTTAVGFKVASSWNDWFPSFPLDSDVVMIWGALIGAGVGYVLGGVFGRWIDRLLAEAPRIAERTSGPQLFAGGFGVVIGVIVGTVIAVPLVALLPAAVAWPLATLVVIFFVVFGWRVFTARADDVFTSRRSGPMRPRRTRRNGAGAALIVDSSAAIDGRIVELIRSGLVGGEVWVPAFVIDELQAVADSADRSKRRRGRRGLDVLDALREAGTVDLVVIEDSIPEQIDVDAKLVTLASRYEATLVTTDYNLARAAELRGIVVLNPHALGESLRPIMSAGDTVTVRIERAGSEEGQGVGFLEDGTMVVVAEAADSIGETMEVEVANLLRTSVGRMLFARKAP